MFDTQIVTVNAEVHINADPTPPDHVAFYSAFAIGDRVTVLGATEGEVVAVTFSEAKVTYDVALDEGGEVLRNVDSTYVTPDDPEF